MYAQFRQKARYAAGGLYRTSGTLASPKMRPKHGKNQAHSSEVGGSGAAVPAAVQGVSPANRSFGLCFRHPGNVLACAGQVLETMSESPNARRWSSISARVRFFRRSASQSCEHAPPISELIPCCARPLSHAPRLMPTTDCQSQFLTKEARVCNGEPIPAPLRVCPARSGAPAGPISVSSLTV